MSGAIEIKISNGIDYDKVQQILEDCEEKPSFVWLPPSAEIWYPPEPDDELPEYVI
jgi:hypothetical protein